MTEKIFGPAIMEREQYMRIFLEEHLCNKDAYQQIDREEVVGVLRFVGREAVEILLEEEGDQFQDSDRIYFKRKLKKALRFPQIYGMPKVQKEGEVVPFRPTNSQCGSIFAPFQTYCDYYLQFFIATVPSYLKDLDAFLDKIRELDIPNTAVLLTSDAVLIYTNIDPDKGIEIVKRYMERFKNKIKVTIPITL